MPTLTMRIILLLCLALGTCLCGPLRAGEDGVHVSLATDEDGDDVILMESEWISMHLLPWRQALINRFVFTPTGNDIVEATNAKIRMAGGGGILMDCFWEQDWRFQELGYKPYEYTITKNGPDEAQVSFETTTVGWLGADGSGVISKLLSNLTLKRTVTLKRGQPFFRFDFEFVNNDQNAKRPTFWVHNASYISRDVTDTMIRPTARGLSAIGPNTQSFPARPGGEDFIRDFNHGWTANINVERREGIVYLMDYDYVDTLYNCGNTTTEWFYDSILVPHNRPWKGRAFILPVIGLSRVDYANEYFIAALQPRREEGKLVLEFEVTSSYEKASRLTMNTEVEHGLLDAAPKTEPMPAVTLENLAIQPARGRTELPLTSADPLVFNVSAVVELPDGAVKKFDFQSFYTGDYKLKGNERDVIFSGIPVKKLKREVHRPALPDVPASIAIDRSKLKLFGVFGIGSYRLGLSEAVAAIPSAQLDVGYCFGNDASQSGLGDFPYDYERLFGYRALIISGAQDKEFRRIGASILLPWLKAGGGLVTVGGFFSYSYALEEHEINSYYPLEAKAHNLRKGLFQLQKPEVPSHPVFRGVDMSHLPWLQIAHDVQVKKDCGATVLMKAGDLPFLVEKKTGQQITMALTANGFGSEKASPGHPALREWAEWPKLFANIVRYAAGDLK